MVRELVGLDEVAPPELGRVDVELVGRVLDEPLDEVRRLGHPERAPVGDPAGRLVGVGAVGDDVGGREVVGPGDDVEQPGPELARLGVGVERAVVREHVDPQPEHLALVAQGQLAGHVVVAGEPGRDEVLGSRLDPLDRPADEQRRRRGHDVPGVDRHLVAEAAPDVGRDDADVLLGKPGHDGEQRPVGVGRLRRHVDRDVLGRRVDVGHAPARLERRWMRPWVEGVERDDDVGLGEGPVGRLLLPGLPVVAAVVGLALLLVPDQRRVVGDRLPRVDDGGQWLVLDVDEVERVVGDVGRLGHHRRHLLALEPNLVGRQHGLGVARQRRHPRQPVGRQHLPGHHGDHPGHGLRRRGVDVDDPGVGNRAAQQGQMEHSRQHDVVDEPARALDQPVVLPPAHGVADAADLVGGRGGAGRAGGGAFGRRHALAPALTSSVAPALGPLAPLARSSAAAARIALTMLM